MIKKMKSKLARISPKSLRYRMVTSIWSARRMRNAHACTFYWVYMPTSILAHIAMAILYVLGFIVQIPLALCGRFFTLIDDKKNASEYVASDAVVYNQNFNPITGKTWRFPPIVPIAIIALVTLLILFPAGVWNVVFNSLIVVIPVLLFLAVLFGLGALITHNKKKIIAQWDKLCPPLEVKNEDSL